MPAVGPPQVLVDNGPEIDAAVAEHNESVVCGESDGDGTTEGGSDGSDANGGSDDDFGSQALDNRGCTCATGPGGDTAPAGLIALGLLLVALPWRRRAGSP
jgi:MYXO-CTERM domain-containing protein